MSANGKPQMQEKNLHRNNAAEWVLWAVLLPVAWLLRLVSRRGGR